MTTLLELLASMRPEDLREGAQIEVERGDGEVFVVTIGPRVEGESLDDMAEFRISS